MKHTKLFKSIYFIAVIVAVMVSMSAIYCIIASADTVNTFEQVIVIKEDGAVYEETVDINGIVVRSRKLEAAEIAEKVTEEDMKALNEAIEEVTGEEADSFSFKDIIRAIAEFFKKIVNFFNDLTSIADDVGVKGNSYYITDEAIESAINGGDIDEETAGAFMEAYKSVDGKITEEERAQAKAIFKNIVEKADNGEYSEELTTVIKGVQKRANEYDQYTSILDEVGVSGNTYYINIDN